ncbi:MAG: hypothetical protein M5U22_22710 [Thermoleophilia bacterium]|nr:hypothetical protein [Thermoleophilia bacterium]
MATTSTAMLTTPSTKEVSAFPAMIEPRLMGAPSSRAMVPRRRSSSSPLTPNVTVKKTKKTAMPAVICVVLSSCRVEALMSRTRMGLAVAAACWASAPTSAGSGSCPGGRTVFTAVSTAFSSEANPSATE